MSYFETKLKEDIHTPSVDIFKKIHICLVNPENAGNLGSIARVMENMGVCTDLLMVGSKELLIDSAARRLAVHAADKLSTAKVFTSLKEALHSLPGSQLVLGTTARVGSAHRPHPLWLRDATEKAVQHIVQKNIASLVFVFGCESDGLNNEDLALCDWVVTIPSSSQYRSLNLSQAVMISCYEFYMSVIEAPKKQEEAGTQKQRLIQHMLTWAEKVGFVLPGDPARMRPQLEKIFQNLPSYLDDVKTLHGLIDQTIRSLDKGYADIRGRYKHWTNKDGESHVGNE